MGHIGWREYTARDLRKTTEGVFFICASHINKESKIDLTKPVYLSTKRYEESKKLKLYGGEIVLVRVGATIGKVAIIPDNLGKACINANLIIIKNLQKHYNKYLFYFFNTALFKYFLFRIKSVGIHDSLSLTAMNDMLIPIPPIEEQKIIANYLDKKILMIDSAIKKKNKIIDLLKEQQTVVINNTVTKGLSLNKKLKPSNIGWIGDIPCDWEIRKLKYKALINAEFLSVKENMNSEIDYIDIGSVSSDGSLKKITKYSYSEAPTRARRIVKSGDTIFSTTRTYLKAIAYIENASGNLVCSTGFAVITPKECMVSKYIYYYCRSEAFIRKTITLSAGIDYSINMGDLKNIEVLVPPVLEQQEIVRYLDNEISISNDKINKELSKIKLLKEYKASLINELVTGKTKVV